MALSRCLRSPRRWLSILYIGQIRGVRHFSRLLREVGLLPQLDRWSSSNLTDKIPTSQNRDVGHPPILDPTHGVLLRVPANAVATEKYHANHPCPRGIGELKKERIMLPASLPYARPVQLWK